jgi:hypothetical protein
MHEEGVFVARFTDGLCSARVFDSAEGMTAGLNWHGVQLNADPLPASPETGEELFLQVLFGFL